MPTYQFTDSSTGKTYQVDGDSPPTEDEMHELVSGLSSPAGLDSQPAASSAANADAGPMSMSDVAEQALGNAPASAMEFGKSIAQAALHPINTATTAVKLGGGIVELLLDPALRAIIPEGSWMWNKSNNPDQAGPAPADLARSVGKFYAQKYGSVEDAKRAIASDPVGVLSDISSVFGVGEAAIPGKIGQMAGVASKVTNPVNIAAQAAYKTGSLGGQLAGSIAAKMLGESTGAGSAAIKEAAISGATGGANADQFLENLRGNVDPAQVVTIAKDNLAKMREARGQQYRSGMVDITNDKSILDLGDVDSSINAAQGRVSFKGQVKDANAADALGQVKKMVDDWKALDPAQYHTPEGLDALKQQIGSVLESIPFEQRNTRAVVGDIYNTVKSTISKQAPTYSRVMSQYESASNTLKETEKALSLGDKASIDTALRKLTSIMRNNVNTNFGQRAKLAENMQKAGGQTFVPGLAGQALNSWSPRGIQGGIAGLTGLGAFSVGGFPAAVATTALSSPRLMGEAAYYAGKAGGKINSLAGMTPEMLKNIQMYNTMHQVQNAGNQQQ